MKRLACISGCLLVFAFAPAPPTKTESDPDKLIQQFEKNVKGKDAETVQARKTKLIAALKKLQTDLVKQGKTEKSEAVRERLLLMDAVSADHLLGTASPADLLKKAAAGKYQRLTRVLLVPADQANYTQYSDFGFWQGTEYIGVKDLSPGYWVYIYPRWYLWRDGPKP